MKVLFTLTRPVDPLKGGVQRITYNLGRFFSEQGLSVFYYSLQCHSRYDNCVGEVFYSPSVGTLRNRTNAEHFADVIKEIQPDIVINQMPYERELVKVLWELKAHCHYKIISCIHNSLFSFKDSILDRLKRHSVLRRMPVLAPWLISRAMIAVHFFTHGRELRSILRRSDRLVLYTKENISELQFFVGEYLREKVLSMPNPISAIEYETREKEKIVLHVGSINSGQKRSDLLLDFWRLASMGLPNWRFVVVGDGPYLAELRRLIDHFRVERIDLVGRRNPDEYYERASIFMMPSAFEGFPNTIIEAHHFGCPVLAFRTFAALRSIVNDGADSVLIDPYDVQAMAEAAIELGRDSRKLESMRNRALENARRFRIEEVGGRWIRLFGNIVM